MPYLFSHFKEKLTPDGEQVYFALSRDGYHWEPFHGGAPVLTCTKGAGGCRDITLVKLREGGYVILATDLCIVHRMDERHNVDWKDCNHNGSKYLSLWRSDDLLHWGEQELVFFGREDFGCLWAPEVFCDDLRGEYLIHWGSTVAEDGYNHMSVYCCVTKDFRSFSAPKLFFTKKNEILDSHLTKVGDTYHLFYKNSSDPAMNMHATAKDLYGPYENDAAFEAYMASLGNAGAYEAPTTMVLPDGRWCLLLDFFGCEKEKMGYVPFLSPAPGNAAFTMDRAAFSFPYGFKHGGVTEITREEYDRLRDSERG